MKKKLREGCAPRGSETHAGACRSGAQESQVTLYICKEEKENVRTL